MKGGKRQTARRGSEVALWLSAEERAILARWPLAATQPTSTQLQSCEVNGAGGGT